MIKHILCTGLISIGIACTTDTFAFDSSSEECSQEALVTNFPPTLLQETLQQFNIPQDQWAAIRQELSAKDKAFVKNLEEKASRMEQNPFLDPQERQAAVKLFRDTLYESFSEVMKAHGITDETLVHAMLDDIQQKKAKAFARCFKTHALTPSGEK